MSHPLQANSADQHLGTVLHRAGYELRTVSEQVARIQNAIGDLLDQLKFSNSINVVELQTIDRAAQQIEGISQFLMGLSTEAHDTWVVDCSAAVNAIQIGDLALRLSGQQRADATADAAGGDELFD